MNTAASVAARIAAIDAHAYTLEGGYAVNQLTGARVTFEAGRVESVTRNDSGRCTACTVRYADGSRLAFNWSKARGSRLQVRA